MRRGYISGASLLESVIAISIISGCLLVALQVFSSVSDLQPPKQYYQQQQALNAALAGLVIPKQALSESLVKQNALLESTTETGANTDHDLLLEQAIVVSKDKQLKLWTFKSEWP